jgi:hypothetical protein
MILLKEPSSHWNHSSPTFQPHGAETGLVSARNLVRLSMLVVLAGVVLCAPAGIRVHAMSGQAAPVKDTIDPDSMAALTNMGTYLRSLKALQVDADITNDDVLDDGQIVTTSHKSTILATSPNHLHAEIKSDDKDVFLFYDGKNFTVYGRLTNFYATVPAPPTTGELINKINSDYGIEVPLVDLFLWGTDESTIKRITSAIDVGPATIEGVTCEQYAFRQEGIDWQIWIQLGDFPLPRKLVIRTLTDDARPQHTSTLSWNLAPSYNEAAFTFDPPEGAMRVPLEQLPGAAAAAKKTTK